MLLTNQIIVFSGYWYLWKESCDILVFFMGSIIKQRKHLELLALVRCCQIYLSCNQISWFYDHLGRESVYIYLRIPLLVGCDQLSFLLNGITGFFDHESLWEKSNDILLLSMELFDGVSHQWKVAPDTTTFDWLLLGQIGFQDSLTLEEINLFLYMDITICIYFFPTLSNFAGIHLIISSWLCLTFTLHHIFWGCHNFLELISK